MGPASVAENVGAIGSVVSGEESGACGDPGGTATTQQDAAMSRTCSNVARPDGEAARVRDAVDAVASLKEAIVELDAGRIEAAKARLGALVATVRASTGRTQSGSRAPW